MRRSLLISSLFILLAIAIARAEDSFVVIGNTPGPEAHALVTKSVLAGKDVLDSGAYSDLEVGMGALTTQDIFHLKTHLGHRFSLATHQTITGSGTFYVLISTGASTQTHFTWQAESTGPAHIHLYESPTASGGTSYYLPNRNRNSSIVSTISILAGPTVTSTGSTLISSHNMTTGKNQGGQTIGDEWILKLSTSYLFEFLNTDAQPIQMDFEFRWAEF